MSEKRVFYCAVWLAKRNYRSRFKAICLSERENRFFLSKKFLELDGSSQKHCIIFVPFLFYLEQLKEEATKPISWTAIAGGSVAGVVLLVIVLTSIVWRRRSTLCPLNYQGNKHDTDKL